jgi:superfamily I DNA/RNA helicase
MIAPVLSGDALAAVRHRGSHMQITASAGSGKTEVVAQRFADLMASGADLAGIIAFTFTERAAQELKARISARVEEQIGPQAHDRLGRLCRIWCAVFAIGTPVRVQAALACTATCATCAAGIA